MMGVYYLSIMSIISSRSAKSREGFTPYQSEEGDLREISLFSRLNLNDEKVELEGALPLQPGYNKSTSDLLSVGSKKRKLSEELMNSSKVGSPLLTQATRPSSTARWPARAPSGASCSSRWTPATTPRRSSPRTAVRWCSTTSSTTTSSRGRG